MKEKNILIADDQKDYCFLVQEYLEEFPLKFHFAYNGQEAVNICQKENIDLVLMDVKMPVLNGFEAAMMIKTAKPKLPIIIQTAYAKELRRDEVVLAIVDDVIHKPIIQKELISIVKKILKFDMELKNV
ncbi:MAG: response regulator [Bacteroidota bacterium]